MNDSAHPYGQDAEHPFSWIRGYHLGGRSLTSGRVTPRLGPINFTENAEDGHGVDWPIRYEDIRPWYDHVERFIGVPGQSRTMTRRRPRSAVSSRGCRSIAARRMSPRDRENLSRPAADDRAVGDPDTGSGRPRGVPLLRAVPAGCSTGSYFRLDQARRSPPPKRRCNLTIVTDAIVEGLDHDPATRKVSGVRVIDSAKGTRTTYRGRIVFLNASTLGSTQILLNSTSEQYPDGIGNRSGVLGHYLMDHLMTGGAFGIVPGMLDSQPIGNRPAGLSIAAFPQCRKKDAPFLRGYDAGAAARSNWTRGAMTPGFGAPLKHAARAGAVVPSISPASASACPTTTTG